LGASPPGPVLPIALRILVLNTGSSSIKYQVIEPDSEAPLWAGSIERIGEADAGRLIQTFAQGVRVQSDVQAQDLSVRDHHEALTRVLDLLQGDSPGALDAVGHRVVHGGERFTEAVQVDDAVEAELGRLSALAPLHNPHNVLGIQLARARLPDLPQVAVFDTAFHATLPPHAFHYALPSMAYARYGIRRYGFHGTSHAHVLHRTCTLLGTPPSALRLISLHLGNGASVCAIQAGRSVETSMGFTPLEGLVMGTRSGDVDPAAVLYLMDQEGLSPNEAVRLLNEDSGLEALSGQSRDLRTLLSAEASGDPRSALALAVYVHRIRKYVGAYAAVLNGVDALAFTGGVGENAPEIRNRIVDGLAFLGLQLDPDRNAECVGGREGPIHAGGVPCLVIQNGEERSIARQTAQVLLQNR
jgi:acetate kinase